MSERLDRIEAALDRQAELNASLRTSIEILKLSTEETRASVEETRASVEALLQIVIAHQGDITALAESIRQHRSDGHGN